MITKIVGIGDIGISNGNGELLKTMALGSCVAVIFYARKIPMAAMAHIALPDSSINRGKADRPAGYFADTAIQTMLQIFNENGIKKNSELEIKIIGGAAIMDPNETFNIGKRNILAIRKLLWKHRLATNREDIGQNYSRTVSVNVKNGKITISSPGKGVWEL